MKHSILVVEDEGAIARVLELELVHVGYEVQIAGDGITGLELALNHAWSLIILDIMLPGCSGLEVLKQLRESGSSVPVILLTARGTTPDIVNGFKQGANDYVTKPFEIEELLARIRNLLSLTAEQNSKALDEDRLQAADLTLNLKSRKALRAEKPIDLTPTEYDLLYYLLTHEGQVLSREQIINDVWGYEHAGDTNIVDVYIRYLRRKIDSGFQPKLIKTCRGIGYKLEAPEV